MDTNDGTDGQMEKLDPLGQASWLPDAALRPLEAEMIRRAAAGALTDLPVGLLGPAEMPSWGEGRTVRASVLRHLLTSRQWPVHQKGVRLRGMRISGQLDLEAATVRCPLTLDCCYLDAQEPVCFDQAEAEVLRLTGCVLAGLTGEHLVAKAIDFSGCTFKGPLNLSNGSISGDLRCSGAHLEGSDKGGALLADGIHVSGSVLLDREFTARGAVRLVGAVIAGQLACSGARLTCGAECDALVASTIKVGGDVLLDEGFIADGVIRIGGAVISGRLVCSGAHLDGRETERGCALLATGMRCSDALMDKRFTTTAGGVRLVGAQISGQFSCRGARLTGCDVNGNALHCEGTKVGGPVLLDEGFTAAGAVCLLSADIAGQLSCRGARLTGRDTEDSNALHCDGMKVGGDVFIDLDGSAAGGHFTAAGAVSLVAATIAGKLQCTGAQLTGANKHGDALVADGIKVGRVLFNAGFSSSAGAVRLHGANITGPLDCRGAQLTAASTSGYSLAADRVTISGNVYLHEGFTATGGAVQLPGANITGQLRCSGAHFGADQSGCALAAERIKVGGDMYLDAGFTAAGAVRLSGADIIGHLRCGGAHLKKNHEGVALACDGAKVGRDLFLDEGFTATGELVLKSARVGGSAILGFAAPAISAAGLEVVDSLKWTPPEPVDGTVSLEGVSAARLEDHWTQDNTASNGYWPVGGKLLLDGFTYGGFSGKHPATMVQRLGWIRSQYSKDNITGRWDGFNPQPYEQLAAAYRKAGRDSDARAINIARRADLRRYGNLGRYRKVGNRLLDWTIRYGYQTWRAAAGLGAVFVVFLVLSILSQHQHIIVPIGNIQGLHPVPSATRCTSDYPCFYPIGYTVDTVIPIINVHQADHWGPDGHAQWGWVWISAAWIATGLGWSLATLLAAGYTGLVRRD